MFLEIRFLVYVGVVCASTFICRYVVWRCERIKLTDIGVRVLALRCGNFLIIFVVSMRNSAIRDM